MAPCGPFCISNPAAKTSSQPSPFTSQDVVDVIAASGKYIIIFETVGIGQAEHDVVKAVDLTVVVLMPGTGDEIQLMKAGLMEIADIFVINKTDKKGANRLAQTLQALLHSFSNRILWNPQLLIRLRVRVKVYLIGTNS